MRIFKSYPFLKLINSYIVDAPVPSNINYLWNFGSLLALCLVIQIITGVTLAMHYNPSVLEAFNSVEHIMRDVNNGWLVRYLHSNTASAFFFLVYLHMGRSLYYGSYRNPRTLTWTIGTVIFLIMIVTGFLGLSHSPKWFKFNNNKQENSLMLDAPTDEDQESRDQESHYSQKLFVEKEYYKNTRYSFNNKSYYSSFTNGGSKRQFSTSYAKCKLPESPKVKDEENGNTSKKVTQFLKDKNLNPVFIYENLGESSIKSKIYQEVKNLSGIYLVLNKFTGDYYIGSASTNRFYGRFCKHLINKNGSKILKAAVNKYKISSFAFIVLEIFPEVITKENNKNLLDLEDFYLKSLLPNYNILTEAGNSFGYKHTEITRINMKSNYSEERKKSSLATLNRAKPVYTEQGLLNLKKKSKSIIVYNFDGTVYGGYSSIVEGAKALGCDTRTITRALETPKQILRRRWIIKLSDSFNK